MGNHFIKNLKHALLCSYNMFKFSGQIRFVNVLKSHKISKVLIKQKGSMFFPILFFCYSLILLISFYMNWIIDLLYR